MVLIGAPLGLMSGRGGIGASATMSILIFMIYWFFLISGEDLADRGKVDPVYAMWSANVVIGLLGIVLVRYASRGVKISFAWIGASLEYILVKLRIKDK